MSKPPAIEEQGVMVRLEDDIVDKGFEKESNGGKRMERGHGFKDNENNARWVEEGRGYRGRKPK